MNVATPFVFFFHFYSPSLFLHIPLFYCLANLNIFFLFVVATTLTVHVNKSIPVILMFILFSFFFLPSYIYSYSGKFQLVRKYF